MIDSSPTAPGASPKRSTIHNALQLLCLGFIVTAIILIRTGAPSFTRELVTSSSLEQRLEWHLLVDTTFNATIWWRLDLLVVWLQRALFPSTLPVDRITDFPTSLVFTQLGIAAAGLVVLIRHFKRSLFTSVGMSVVAALITLQTSGYSVVISGALCWVPWLCWAICRCRHSFRQTLLGLLLVSYFSLRCTVAGGPLSPALVLWTCVIGLALSSNHITRSAPRFRNLILFVALAPVAWLLYTYPSVPFPNYPHFAHVVPDDGIAGNIGSLATTMPPIPIIDAALIKQRFFLSALTAILVCLLLASTRKVLTHQKQSTCQLYERTILIWLVAIPAILLGLEFFLSPDIAMIGPLATLGRVVPLQMLYPISLTILGGITLLSPMLLAARPHSKANQKTDSSQSSDSLYLPLFCAAALVPTVLLLGKPFNEDELVTTSRKASTAFHERFQSTAFDDPLRLYFERIVVSPTYRLLNDYGLWIIDYSMMFDRPKFTPVRSLKPEVTTSSISAENGEVVKTNIKGMLRNKPGSRWTTKKGRQDGEEWVHLQFPTPLTIRGVELSAGKYHTDFPRGIRVRYDSKCSSGETHMFATYKIAAEHPRWQGSLGLTSDSHFYLGPESVVKVFFPQAITASCLLLEQIGYTPHFDWSISTLRVLAQADVPEVKG